MNASPSTARHLPMYRAECSPGPRPCPYVSCRHHLGHRLVASMARRGSSDDEIAAAVLEMDHTCSLDYADDDDAGREFADIAECIGVSRESIRNWVTGGLERLSRSLAGRGLGKQKRLALSRTYSDETKQTAIEMLKTADTIRVVSEALGIPRATLTGWAAAAGIANAGSQRHNTRHGVSNARRLEVVNLAENIGVAAASAETGVARNTIYFWISKKRGGLLD